MKKTRFSSPRYFKLSKKQNANDHEHCRRPKHQIDDAAGNALLGCDHKLRHVSGIYFVHYSALSQHCGDKRQKQESIVVNGAKKTNSKMANTRQEKCHLKRPYGTNVFRIWKYEIQN